MTALYLLSGTISPTVEPDAMLADVATELRRLLPADGVALYLLEDDGLAHRRALAFGAELPEPPATTGSGQGALGRCLTDGRAVLAAPDRGPSGAVWTLALPLRVGGQQLGALVLVRRTERPLAPEDRDLLEMVAAQLAMAIQNGRLYRGLVERERRLSDLVGRLLLAQEEERRRVAYDLHDGLAQVAVGAQQHLEAFAAHYRPRTAARRQELDLARELARRTVGEARRVIAGLRPTILDDFGLATALRLEAEALRQAGWTVDYLEQLGEQRLPPTIETALFRVAQEALTNVRKHAATRQVRLSLWRDSGAARLEVQDWGRGFQPSAVLTSGSPSERVGLAGMVERIAWLGGQCTVRSRPDVGTLVAISVPLPTDTVSGREVDDGG